MFRACCCIAVVSSDQALLDRERVEAARVAALARRQEEIARILEVVLMYCCYGCVGALLRALPAAPCWPCALQAGWWARLVPPRSRSASFVTDVRPISLNQPPILLFFPLFAKPAHDRLDHGQTPFLLPSIREWFYPQSYAPACLSFAVGW